jgi:hypothetical protein
MNAKRLIICSVLGLVVTALGLAPALGDGPSTRPDTDGGMRQQMRFMRGMLRNDPNAGLIYFTQDEWNDMMSFLQLHSHARAQVLARATNLPQENSIRQALIRRWRAYKFVRDHFPEMARLQERRFELEDDLFKLAMDVRDLENVSAGPVSGSADDLRERIHAKLAELLDLGIQEDQLRVEKLQTVLKDMNAKLARDQASEPAIIENRTENLMGRYARPTSRPSGVLPHGDATDGGTNTLSDQIDTPGPTPADADSATTVN